MSKDDDQLTPELLHLETLVWHIWRDWLDAEPAILGQSQAGDLVPGRAVAAPQSLVAVKPKRGDIIHSLPESLGGEESWIIHSVKVQSYGQMFRCMTIRSQELIALSEVLLPLLLQDGSPLLVQDGRPLYV